MGYAHAEYAHALSEFGAPRLLPKSGGWLLVTPVGGSAALDARGCYPLFTCQDWGRLGQDLDRVGSDLVSVVMVADPFGGYQVDELRGVFPDLCQPYKEHYVVDLENPVIAAHHQRNIRKARVDVERCQQPEQHAEDWIRLYANLVQRHHIRGIAAFSEFSLRRQLSVPGLVVFRAVQDGETAGIVLWYTHNEVGYYHLAAYSESGYQSGASYALFAQSIAYFQPRLRWLNLGAGSGVYGSQDGLTRFKSGWASGTRPAFLLGRIFDRAAYQELVRARGIVGEDFFPLYRKGEMR